MILFSSPKPFTPQTTPVQLSAIRSWKRALPEARVILFGNEPGLERICRKEDVFFGGEVETDEGGFEIISSIFKKAKALEPNILQIYLNSDILLDVSASAAVTSLCRLTGPFLATARRRCLSPWSGPALGENELVKFLDFAKEPIRWGQAGSLDIFIFRDFPVETMPEFLIGHAAWDNWMIFQARWLGIPTIDLSRVLRPFHCDHDYAYSRGNPQPRERNRALDQRNLRLLGGEYKKFHLGHCDHELMGGNIIPRHGPEFRQRQLEFLRVRHPIHESWIRPGRALFRPWLRKWEQQTTRLEDWNQGVPSASTKG